MGRRKPGSEHLGKETWLEGVGGRVGSCRGPIPHRPAARWAGRAPGEGTPHPLLPFPFTTVNMRLSLPRMCWTQVPVTLRPRILEECWAAGPPVASLARGKGTHCVSQLAARQPIFLYTQLCTCTLELPGN